VQIAKLHVAVMDLRTKSSRLRLDVARLQQRLSDAENVRKFSAEEDNVKKQHVQGGGAITELTVRRCLHCLFCLRRVTNTHTLARQAKIAEVETQLGEETVYHEVLKYMERRLGQQKLTEQKIAAGLQDALALNKSENQYVLGQVQTARVAVAKQERKLLQFREHRSVVLAKYNRKRAKLREDAKIRCGWGFGRVCCCLR
jgi:hypothetical protein